MENIQKLIESIPITEWNKNEELKLAIIRFKQDHPGYNVEIEIINEHKGNIKIICG